MSRGWSTKGMFLIDQKRAVKVATKKKAQVQIGPEVFPPPSEDEVQDLVDKLEGATNDIDIVAGYDATLNARFGKEFVEYLNKLSDGMHYLLLQGRRPGPPPGFEAGQPPVEFGGELPPGIEEPPEIGGPGGLGEEEVPALPGGEAPLPELGGGGVGEMGEGLPPMRPAAQRRSAALITANLDEAVTDFERLVGDGYDALMRHMERVGASPDVVARLTEAADKAREAVASVKRTFKEFKGE